MNRKVLRYTVMGITGTFIVGTIEECLEPAHLTPHAEQEDFSPLPFEQSFPWIASGSSIAANSFVGSQFTIRGMNVNSVVAGFRGPFDDV